MAIPQSKRMFMKKLSIHTWPVLIYYVIIFHRCQVYLREILKNFSISAAVGFRNREQLCNSAGIGGIRKRVRRQGRRGSRYALPGISDARISRSRSSPCASVSSAGIGSAGKSSKERGGSRSRFRAGTPGVPACNADMSGC